MTTYVLVPGAWLGGWAWDDVGERLRAQGHDVHQVTLTGVGDRFSERGDHVTAATHVQDVVDVVEGNDLREAILVGHSYAGAIPVPGAVHRIGDRLSHVVYVDSAPLGDGRAMTEITGPEGAAHLAALAREHGEGVSIPFPGAANLGDQSSVTGLTPPTMAAIDARATGHPLGSFLEPLRLHGPAQGGPRNVLVACEDFRALLDSDNPWLRSLIDENWTRFDLETGHWPMFSDPEGLSRILAELPRR
ncbi:pimeloyl-ACP methyl ester carboxylesterase [Stackebrandtia albiflava]|uniref:Pimeloyl-ACP methyl ester carboxylesterase n=1 Tax=Stackebrandtia albiflava TaxID=406432 RepID=A0A562V4Y3_9ACTN|nr:alpha/beta hydrolase [Stackebrandtia albiflava]TWJ12954.1 pimeloyl-ACP methyl ester carboxylesterase [Stackebrandtia albiflava]